MWRYIEGVKCPKPKRSVTDEERSQYLKEYENKRSRKFQDSWKLEFKWLEYSEIGEGIMTCHSCRTVRDKSEIDNQFISGCVNFKKETLKKHENSDFHKKSCNMLLARNKPTGSSEAEKIVQTLNKVNIEKLTILFRNVHALVKHSRPFTDYVWMCEVDEKKGLQIGNTYRTDKKAREFTCHISAIVKEVIKKEIKQAKFISVLCDGATDSAIIEEEILYIRYSIKGNIIIRFISLKQVEKADAQGIFRAIMTAFEELELLPELKNKVVALGTDGARVMLGHKNGVISLMQQHLNDKIIPVHCFAHRLELSYKEALKNINLYNTVYNLIMGLYYFYHNSPLNRSNLKNACATLNITYLVPTRIGGTRWISHLLKAIQHILKIYPGIVTHLEQMIETTGASSEAKSKAKGYLKLLKMKDNVTFLAFLVDVLVPLSILSQQFQQKYVVISDIYSCIKNTLTHIENYKDKNSPEVRKLETSDYFKQLGTALILFPDAKIKTIESLTKCISSRFSDVMEKGLIASTSIANLKVLFASIRSNEKAAEDGQVSSMKSKEMADGANYGNQEIQQLTSHFGPILMQAGVEIGALEREWEMLTVCLQDLYKDKKNILDWEAINMLYGEVYPNILLLIDLILSIPASTAQCERGFSCMRKVKTDWRNSLGDKILSDLLLVQLESAPIATFDPLPAIHHWNSSGSRSRRPTFYENQPAHSSKQATITADLNLPSSDTDITSDSDNDLFN